MKYIKEIARLIHIDSLKAEEIEKIIEEPKDSNNGDYALPCFKLAKLLKKSPIDIANKLVESCGKSDVLESVEAVNGYINFKLNKIRYLKEKLNEISDSTDYGISDIGKGKTVCIDYSSINIAKPFHMGHLSTTVIGAALCRIYGKLSYKTVGINHLGDYGTQFGKLIAAYKKWGELNEIEKGGISYLSKLYVKFHSESKVDPKLENEGREWFRKIENKDEEALAIFNKFKEITLKDVEKTYKRLNVTFDSYAGESFYTDKMQPVLDELKEKNLLKISEGATVVEFKEDMPPCLLVKADGATLYATRDLAAAFYRKKVYDFYKCLYVVAYQQNLHFKQWFKIVDYMGYEWAKDLVHVAFGMVSLEDGAMKSREGRVVLLEDVLNKAHDKALQIIDNKNPSLLNKEEVAETIGTGAVIFNTLSGSRIKDIVFSYDKALNFDGETGPYVQYTYARCKSLMEKGGEIEGEINYNGINTRESYELTKLMARYPMALKEAAERYEPSIITRLVTDIAQAFNRFYLSCRIINAEKDVKNAGLKLVAATANVIKSAMEVIGIKCPEQM